MKAPEVMLPGLFCFCRYGKGGERLALFILPYAVCAAAAFIDLAICSPFLRNGVSMYR